MDWEGRLCCREECVCGGRERYIYIYVAWFWVSEGCLCGYNEEGNEGILEVVWEVMWTS